MVWIRDNLERERMIRENLERERRRQRQRGRSVPQREVRIVRARSTTVATPRFTKESLSDAEGAIFEIQEQLPNGAYLTLMNLLKDKDDELERS